MMRILFVDDEQNILDGIQRALFDSDWDIETANSGEDALECFEEEPFDVIVSDMRMPGMDGEKLLGKIEEKYPDTVRVVLSGQADQAAALRSSFISHRWLDKPFDPDELINVLSLIENALNSMPNSEMRRLICGIRSLPSPPRVYAQIQSLIQNNADLENIAAVIEEDAALATKVLQVTNSALFSRGGETTDVHAAVVRLGAEMVKEFVLFAETYSTVSSSPLLDIEKITKESFMISKMAALIAADIDQSMVADAQLAGLLSDLGQGALIQAFPDKAQEYVDRISYATEKEIEEIELELFGLADAQVGAYLLLMWGFSAEIFNAVLTGRLYERSISSSSVLPVIIHMARQLARGIDVLPELIERFDLSEKLPDWKEQAQRLKER
ncbi:hypothetical protein A3765_01280 [Oleiphilus sp. HI0130]|nr:hypothetical protein A3758_10385 [Oleiphilus sp. HI0118]KZZ77037.1 hypothetical protein A3765_01280 [Oleiphilus sp. HI0130]